LISEKPTPKGPPSGGAVQRRKLRVSEALSIDLRVLKRKGFFEIPPLRLCSSRLQWPSGDASEVSFCRFDGPDGPQGILIFRPERPESPRQDNWHAALLTATRPHFGGRRWWFQCPLVVNDVPCRRRCLVLYRPWGAPYFGCRQCHQLTYRTRQVHRNVLYEGFDRLLAAADALDRVRDPRCGVWRTARALRRAHRAEPAIAAMREELERLESL
jgi:hypothetical protein